MKPEHTARWIDNIILRKVRKYLEGPIIRRHYDAYQDRSDAWTIDVTGAIPIKDLDL